MGPFRVAGFFFVFVVVVVVFLLFFFNLAVDFCLKVSVTDAILFAFKICRSTAKRSKFRICNRSLIT